MNSQMPLMSQATRPSRRGNRIRKAFALIPSVPILAEDFAAQCGVSVAVLNQSKRFDRCGSGKVVTITDRATRKLLIWRCS